MVNGPTIYHESKGVEMITKIIMNSFKFKNLLFLCFVLVFVNITIAQSTSEKVKRLALECSKGHKEACKKLKHIALNDNNDWIRKIAVEQTNDQTILVDIAKYDAEYPVRKAAVKKITDPNILADIAKNDTDNGVIEAAIKKINDQKLDPARRAKRLMTI